MFRTLRALIIAAVVAVSLLGGASIASADTIKVHEDVTSPLPIQFLDITWE